MEGVASRDKVLTSNTVDPMEQPQPQSPRPPWATSDVPYGGELLKSGPKTTVDKTETSTAEHEEIVQPKLLPSPAIPSKQEIAENQATHLPQRNWCEDCNNGRLVASQHVMMPEEKQERCR